MQFKDYYKILGVDKAATAEDIKKSYRKLARKYHPDVSKEADAAARMAELNEAHEVLSDPEKRSAYDNLETQTQARHGQDFQPPPHWDAGFEFSDHPGAGPADYSDFFEQLFGRAARSHHRARASGDFGTPHEPIRGSDHYAKIELDLQDAYEGTQRSITLHAARLDAEGRVVNEARTLQVRIPKGIREGQHIRLAGHGNPGLGGGPAGDLLLEVLFRPDPRWHAEGRDVHQRLRLAPWEAMLGTTCTLHTPGGEAQVRVPAGWKPGRKLRLKGRGIPGREPGDLYVDLEVVLPPAETAAQRAAYAALAEAFPTFDPRALTGD